MSDVRPQADSVLGWERVKTVVILFVGFEIVVLILYLVGRGPEKLLQHGVRTALAALLAWALVRRQRWARWLMLILVAIGLWNGAPLVSVLWRSGEQMAAFTSALMLLVYLILGRILLWSPHLRAYLAEDQRPTLLTRPAADAHVVRPLPIMTALDRAFENLARTFLSEHPDVGHEWRQVNDRFWGDRSDLICGTSTPSQYEKPS